MKMKQIYFPTVSAFMHALGRDDVRHPLIEVIHLDDLADCSSFSNTRYTFGFYCVVYKDARCGTVRYGRNEYDYDNGTLLFFAPEHDVELGTLEQSYKGVMLIFSPTLMLPRFLTKGNLDYFSFLTKFIVMLIFYLHL